MPHTIAVAGKGGVGKTTTCGMLIDYLCKKNRGPVLVVDADANSNLNEVLGVEIDAYVSLSPDALVSIVDAIGGVYFDVPYNMDYHDPYQNLSIEQEKGYRLLNGVGFSISSCIFHYNWI